MFALAFLYGVLRKFSRMSWLGYQTLIVFALTLILGSLPQDNGALLFSLALGFVVGGAAILFVAGILLRKPFLSMEKNGVGLAVVNRLLGGLGAVVNLAVVLAVIAALALVSLQGLGLEVLAPVYGSSFWADFFGVHALDLVLVFVFLSALQGGYRSGLMRMIVNIIIIALVFLSVFLSMYMVLQVPFLTDFAHAMGGSMAGSLGRIGGNWVGFVIASFIVSLVFLAVTIVIGILLNLFLKFLGKFRVTVIINGGLGFLINGALLIGILLGVSFGVAFLAGDGLVQAVPEDMHDFAAGIQSAMQGVEQFFTSSTLLNVLYTHNPLRALIG